MLHLWIIFIPVRISESSRNNPIMNDEDVSKLSSMSRAAVKILQYHIPLTQCFLRLMKACSSRCRSKFLNQWNTFENHLQVTFSSMENSFYQFKLQTIRNFIIAQFIITP